MEPITLTIARTRELSGLGTTTIYNLINNGTLRTTKVGRRTLIYTSSVRDLLGADRAAA